MLQFDVDLEFDDVTDEPTFFVDEVTSLKWKYEDVEMADWRDNEAQATCIAKLTKRNPLDEIVVLFDGSDTMIYALRGDAIKS